MGERQKGFEAVKRKVKYAAPCQIFIKSMALESTTIITVITRTDIIMYSSSWGVYSFHWQTLSVEGLQIDLMLSTGGSCLAQFGMELLHFSVNHQLAS